MIDAPTSCSWGEIVNVEPRFARLVGRLERLAARDFAGYRRRVIGAGLLGYLVIAGVVVVPLSVLVVPMLMATDWTVGIDLAVGCGITALALLAALRVPRYQNAGYELDVGQAPALFAMIHRVQAAARWHNFLTVQITEDLNASIVRAPRRLGFRHRDTLQLGLPLLFALTASEVEAIVAHEIAHAVDQHHWSSAFIYHVRQRWLQLGGRLAEHGQARLLRRFFQWYGPWFAAYASVLSRQQEFDADRCAAGMVPPAALASALVRTAIASGRLQDLVATTRAKATRRGYLPKAPWRRMLSRLSSDYVLGAGHLLQLALDEQPTLGASHPTLSQRLASLRQIPRVPGPLDPPAAVTLLGSHADVLVAQLDADAHQHWEK